MHRIVLIFVYFVFLNTLSAQKTLNARIVTYDNKVVEGQVENKRWGSTPQSFKLMVNGKEIIFETKKLKAITIFRLDGKKDEYIATIVQVNRSPSAMKELDNFPQPKLVQDTLVLQTIIMGPISFYRCQEGIQTHLFIGTDSIRPLVYKRFYSSDGKMTSVHENNRFRQQLLAVMQDAPVLHEKIKRVTYTQGAIEKLLLAYFKDQGKNVAYQYQEPRYKTAFYASLGMQATRVPFVAFASSKNDFITFPHDDHYFPAVSIGCLYPIPLTNGGILLVNELGTHQTKTEIYNQNFSGPNQWNINTTHIRLQTMLRAYFFHKEGLYAQVGLNNGYLVRNNSKVITKSNGLIVSESPLVIRSYEPGLAGGIGYKFKRFLFDVRYDQNYGLKPQVNFRLNSSRVYTLTASVGYRFR